MELKKNLVTEIKITGTTHDGSGVGRIDDFVVFVPACAEGETVKIQILSVKKKLAYGKILEILKESPKRTSPDCEVYLKCGGCSFRHISYDEELRIKYNRVKDAFRKFSCLDIAPEEILPCGDINHYRNKAQYPVGTDRNGNIIAGFYAPHSHRIVECSNCSLQPIIFSEIVKMVTSWMKQYNVSTYNEETGTGLIRHIFLRIAPSTEEIMVCLVVNTNSNKIANQEFLIKNITEKFKDVKGIILNFNTQNTNSILGKKCVTIFGSDKIIDKMGEKQFEISPLSFYQVNSPQAFKLYTVAKEFADLSGNETLLDLYCGAGTIGLFMSDKVKKLIGVEIVEQAIENAKRNALLNQVNNAEFFCSDSGKAADKLLKINCKPDVIVVDPPRKGCDLLTIDSIAKMNPQKIVYVSCDPATLARDVKLLCERGYDCKRVKPVDMFPRTHHVETVVLMTREKS